ncbi:MAG: tetraacyldisaccharide 4'-kinase, partial [Flavobacteriales bacterium]|nr:tetraacyldisaccharide 4'-kinase [Flavobacteriales bacterium]
MRWSHLITRPLGTIIGLVLRARHWCYDRGVLSTQVPNVPTIAIGNLSLGGTGKTPHVELVVRILLNHRVHPIATLSRGYGRMTKGFREVRPEDAAHAVGDEPLQLKLAHPALHVFVGADRADAVQQIVTLVPGTRIVILDDALQHRRITAGLSVLLTTYAKPYCSDQILPEGTLRD